MLAVLSSPQAREGRKQGGGGRGRGTDRGAVLLEQRGGESWLRHSILHTRMCFLECSGLPPQREVSRFT